MEIPKSVHEALKIPEWKKVVVEEMQALEKKRTWKLVQKPEGKIPIGCKWGFIVKYKADGSIER